MIHVESLVSPKWSRSVISKEGNFQNILLIVEVDTSWLGSRLVNNSGVCCVVWCYHSMTVVYFFISSSASRRSLRDDARPSSGWCRSPDQRHQPIRNWSSWWRRWQPAEQPITFDRDWCSVIISAGNLRTHLVIQ